MNLQEKQQRLRALIPTSNKLTFGCEIITSTDDGDRRTTIIHPVIKKNSKKYLGDRIKVVIGHPPQLNDLLMALGTSKQRNEFFVCDEGYFWECRGCETGKECDCDENNFLLKDVPKFRYDLNADPLSQDEETTDKLLELLNPKGNTIK